MQHNDFIYRQINESSMVVCIRYVIGYLTASTSSLFSVRCLDYWNDQEDFGGALPCHFAGSQQQLERRYDAECNILHSVKNNSTVNVTMPLEYGRARAS